MQLTELRYNDPRRLIDVNFTAKYDRQNKVVAMIGDAMVHFESKGMVMPLQAKHIIFMFCDVW